MRQQHYLEAAARKLQASCPGQDPISYAKTTFEETCPYCFQLLVLDNSRVRLKPKPKLINKIKKLLNREAKGYTLSFKEAKIVKKYKDASRVLLVTGKTCNRTVKHRSKSRSSLSSLKSDPNTPKSTLKAPERKAPSSAGKKPTGFGSKGQSPALTFRTPPSGQSTPAFFSSKNMSKTKKRELCCKPKGTRFKPASSFLGERVVSTSV